MTDLKIRLQFLSRVDRLSIKDLAPSPAVQEVDKRASEWYLSGVRIQLSNFTFCAVIYYATPYSNKTWTINKLTESSRDK